MNANITFWANLSGRCWYSLYWIIEHFDLHGAQDKKALIQTPPKEAIIFWEQVGALRLRGAFLDPGSEGNESFLMRSHALCSLPLHSFSVVLFPSSHLFMAIPHISLLCGLLSFFTTLAGFRVVPLRFRLQSLSALVIPLIALPLTFFWLPLCVALLFCCIYPSPWILLHVPLLSRRSFQTLFFLSFFLTLLSLFPPLPHRRDFIDHYE